jgi:ribosomal protein L6P/L9E
MKDLSSVETLAIPTGVTVAIKARKVTVTGPRGTLHKNVGHVAMDIQIVSRIGIRWKCRQEMGTGRRTHEDSLEMERMG